MLKSFLNSKKIPLNPHFITVFKEKTELFNSFFAKQCLLIRNDRELPTSLTFYANIRLSTVGFSHENFGKIIQNLNPNKTHGHDNISIRMLKICGSTIYRPLEIIFNEALSTVLFPLGWKKGNIVPIHKKVISKSLKTTVPFHCFKFVGKFLKD